MPSDIEPGLVAVALALLVGAALAVAALYLLRLKARYRRALADSHRDRAALIDSEQTFKTIFNDAPISIVIHDGETGAILDANHTAYSQYGLGSVEELQRRAIWRDPPYSGAEALAWIRKAATEGPQTFEWLSRTSRGTDFWELARLSSVMLRGQARVIFTGVDITEAKQASQTLWRQYAFQRMVTEISTDFIRVEVSSLDRKIDRLLARMGEFFAIDRSYFFQFSADGQRMTNTHEWCGPGISEERIRCVEDTAAMPWWMRRIRNGEVIHIADVEVMPAEAAAEQAEFRRQYIRSLLAVPVVTSRTVIGFLGFDSVRAIHVWDQDQAVFLRILGNILAEAWTKLEQDLALIDAKERAEAATRVKSEFLANMSHEIRTPMNAVLGMTELALRADPPPRQHRYLRQIDLAARALLQILNDILDFSKIEAERLELERLPFRLGEVIERVAMITRVQAAEKDLELRVLVDSAVPGWVVGDPLRLGQVLVNLVGNAVKFTHRGWVELAVYLTDQSSAQAMLRFRVSDTGIGMTPEHLTRLCDPFWQADSSMSRRYGGTGLGLPISRQLIELMGGSLQVTSVPGQGSTFRFSVPFAVAPADVTAVDAVRWSDHFCPLPDTSAPVRLDGYRVLLVDDNALNRELAGELLGALGIEVHTAESGAEALHAATAGGFDLILMDIQMPGMDGFEATRAIRRMEVDQTRSADPNSAPRLPIIAMTAHTMPSDRQRCLAAGMNDYLSKPIDSGTLRAMLRRWLPDDRRVPDGPASQLTAASRADTAAPPAVAERARSWPSALPPFDLDGALARCEGRIDLLLRLVGRFVEDYADAPARVRAWLERGEHATAGRLIHTLKSAAAALHLDALAEQAQTVEQALHDPHPPAWDAPLAALEQALQPAIAAARTLLDHTPGGEPLPIPVPVPIGAEPPERLAAAELNAALDRLREQLHHQHLGARETFARMCEQPGTPVADPRLQAVGRHLERLEFDRALAALDRL